MRTINYQKIFSIPKLDKENLVLSFEGVESFNVFEITELFFYCLTFKNFKKIKYVHHDHIAQYLEQFDFFYVLARIKGLTGFNSSFNDGHI